MRDPEAEVVDWAVRTSDPDFTEWDAFAEWLSGDPGRGEAYDRAVRAVAADAQAMARFPPDTVQPAVAEIVAFPRRRRMRRGGAWAALAVAAGLAGVLVIDRRADVQTPQVIETSAGVVKHVVLPDGSLVELAGGSRMILDPAQPRRAVMVRGHAMFSVRHDATDAFSVQAGRHAIVDVGTSFEVSVLDGETAVDVAEGAVVVDPATVPVPLTAGDGVVLRQGSPPRRVSVQPEAVGQWARDRMSYRDAPLTQVADDLSVALGRPIAVGTGLEKHRFSGSLVVAQIRDRPMELAALLGVRVRGDARGWVLDSR